MTANFIPGNYPRTVDQELVAGMRRVAAQEVSRLQRELRKALVSHLDDEGMRDGDAPATLSEAVVGELMNIVANPERYGLDGYGLQFE